MRLDPDDIIRTRVRRKNKFYNLIIDLVGSGPFDGGCLAFAMAMKKVLGSGEVYVVEGDWNGTTQAQHAVLKLHDDLYLDADGTDYGKDILKRLERDEHITNAHLRPYKKGDLPEAPSDPEIVDKIAAYLSGGKHKEGYMSKAKIVNKLIDEQLHDFGQALGSFIHDSQRKIDAERQTVPKGLEHLKLVTSVGPKYVKVIEERTADGKVISRSAWAFIDKETGDVFKPATWKTPAKHARANIFKPNTWSTVSAYGPAYLR